MNIYGSSISGALEEVLDHEVLIHFKQQILQVVQAAMQAFPKELKVLNERLEVIPLEVMQPIELADKLEYHRKFWDLHVSIQGEDLYHFKPLEECQGEVSNYDAENDYGLYEDAPTHSFSLVPGEAVLIDTDLAHMALAGTGTVQKLVFKIAK